MSENLLADITPEYVAHLEQEASTREQFGTVQGVRDAYRTAIFRRATSGGLEIAAQQPITRVDQYETHGAAFPYFRSHYAEWLRMLPLRDVETYAKNAIKSGKYPHLVRPNLENRVLANKLKEGIVATDVIMRFPTTFHEKGSEQPTLDTGKSKIVFAIHAQPKGMDAHAGFQAPFLRDIPGEFVSMWGLGHAIKNGVRPYIPEIYFALEHGYFDEAIDCLLGCVNEIIGEKNWPLAWQMKGV